MTRVSSSRAMPRAFAAVAALLVAAACADSFSPIERGRPVGNVANVTAGLEVVYGPERFTRTRGAPDVFERMISTAGFEAPFVLTVRSGDAAGNNRVSNASVSVDGAVVLGPSDFSRGQHEWSIPVAAGGTVQLSVRLAGAPGVYLDISLEGTRSGVLFCPTGGPGSHATMEAALDAAPVGGTVLVCDGEHNIDSVIISKPVTIRAQHTGMATLGDSDPTPGGQGGSRPAFYVDGVTSGVVRIVDLQFAIYNSVMVAGNLQLTGTWDRIEFDSVRIHGRVPGATNSFAIRTFTSTVSGARLDVRRSHFEDLALGVFAVAEEVHVSESTFDRFTGGSVVYSFVSALPTEVGFGVTENNTFTNCGSAGCVRLVGGGNVTIRGNTIDLPTGPARLGGIVATVNPQHAGTVTIENNQITGARIPATPTDASGWTMARGVFGSAPTAAYSFIVRGNTISGVWTGVFQTVAAGASAEAHDNRISSAFQAFLHQNAGSMIFTRNDATDLIGSFQAPTVALGHYRCNWWGTPAGPNSPPGNVPASRYTPSASAPIAGTALACDPDAP